MKINDDIENEKEFTIENEFHRYLNESYKDKLDLESYMHTKRAFFAGIAIYLFKITSLMKKCTKEDYIAMLKKTKNEIETFFKEE